MTFDMEATFGDDYLYFYEESIDDDHSDADTAEILGLLDLPPGARVLDAPCGHGRIARRLAAAGMEVTGVDLTAAYIEQACADPLLPPGAVTYVQGDLRALPVDGPFDAVVCWLNSFGYYDDADCHRVLAEFHRVLRPGGRWRSTRCTTTGGSATSPRPPTPWSSSAATTPWSRSRPSIPCGAGW